MPPLIVTALLDEAAQERFDRLRREHFPPERSHLAAHLTLFHHLPDEPTVGAADLHLTVQNKADPAAAERLHAQLAAGFEPYDVQVVGLGLWRYLGGPWEPVQRFAFGR